MTRKPLGRGLDALFSSSTPDASGGVADGSESQSQPTAPAPSAPQAAPLTPLNSGPHGEILRTALITDIAPAPNQPRRNFDPDAQYELYQSILEHGILEPLLVRPIENPEPRAPHFELIAGERRLIAARTACLGIVPIIVRNLDDESALLASLVENLMRASLTPVEEARAYNELVKEHALTPERAAEKIGKSRAHVTNLIRLLELPDKVLEMIDRGELNVGQARPLLALRSATAQLDAARRIIASKLTARGAERLVRISNEQERAAKAGTSRHSAGSNATRADTSPRSVDSNLRALVDSLQRAMRRKVRIVMPHGKSAGHLELEFYDSNDLTALAAALTSSSTSS